MDAKIALTQAHDGPEDDKPMPLLDHLIELRKRLIWALVSFFGVLTRTVTSRSPWPRGSLCA